LEVEMRIMLLVLLTFGSVAMAVADDVPDPTNCTCTLDEVGRCLLCPGGGNPWGPCAASAFCVNVRNAANAPINNAVVEILVGGQAGNYTGIASYGGPWTIGNTDASGTVCFNIPGGGCYKHQPDACVIRANGVIVRQYTAVTSPDYTASDDYGIPGRWDCLVTPTDLAAFIACYQGGTGPVCCQDYDNNGTTGPTDLAVFVSAYYGGTGHCPP
jgi:hypothetical protein